MHRNTFRRITAVVVLWLSVTVIVSEALGNKVTSTGYSIIHNTKSDQSSYYSQLGLVVLIFFYPIFSIKSDLVLYNCIEL